MNYVVAIDVGIKNLGICVFDFRVCRVVYWQNVALVSSGRYLPYLNVEYVRQFVTKHKKYFDEAFRVVVERQIRCNMRIIEAVLQSMHYDVCTIVNARSVKVHYDLSTRNYRSNKQAAVDWAQRFIDNNPSAFDLGVDNVFKSKKKDDLADSLLLLMYYLDTYSNQMSTFNGVL